jgi:elongation factor P
VELHVASTEPGVRGDTSKNTMKSATLETGASIQVPLFVETGDLLKIDTRNASYISRV